MIISCPNCGHSTHFEDTAKDITWVDTINCPACDSVVEIQKTYMFTACTTNISGEVSPTYITLVEEPSPEQASQLEEPSLEEDSPLLENPVEITEENTTSPE